MQRRLLALALFSLAAWPSQALAARSLSVSPAKLTTGGTFVVSSTREPRDETECKVTVTRPSGGSSTVSCQGGTGVASEPGIWRFSLIVYVPTSEAKDGYVTLTASLNVQAPAAASATATTTPPVAVPTTPAPTAKPAATAKAPARPAGQAPPAGSASKNPPKKIGSDDALGADPTLVAGGIGLLLLALLGLGLGLRAYFKKKAGPAASASPASPSASPAAPAASPPASPPAGARPKLEAKLVLGPMTSHLAPSGTTPPGALAGPEWSFLVRLPPPVLSSSPITAGEHTEIE